MKRKMTLRQAKSKLKKLAKGKYHSAELRLTGGLIGVKERHTCYLYIAGPVGETGAYSEHSTWEGAFKNLRTVKK